MLDLAILGILETRDLHGYEIRKQLREQLGLLANVSFGSLYPALARLEAQGAVETTEPHEPRRAAPPPTGSLSGEWAILRSHRATRGGRSTRSRKVYRITEQGRRRFADLLSEGPKAEDDRSFELRLAFARHLAPAARLTLLERRRAQLVEQLAAARAASADPGHDVYARSVMEHTVAGIDGDIAWLDQLIAGEDRQRDRNRTATRSTSRETERVEDQS
jgi:DNA-binding PadR family transcriptional regulator